MHLPPIPSRSADAPAWLKRAAAIVAAVSVIGGVLAGFIGKSAAITVELGSFARKADVSIEIDDKIAAHDRKPRAHDAALSPHPDYARAADKVDHLAMAVDMRRSDDRKRDNTLFLMLTSIQVADLETSSKRRAESATRARIEFRRRVAMGESAHVVAEEIVDAARAR